MSDKLNIAIDGPASSGKSTVAKIIAKDFNYIYTDTGAMYRSVTYLALKYQVDFTDEKALVDLIHRYPITFKQAEGGQLVFVDGQDVTMAIRLPEVTQHVSQIAALKAVRQELVKQQQSIAKAGGVVMDGRDIGTVVLPDAQVKIFLNASVEERAQRRYKENMEKGIACDFDELKEAIAKRDYYDSHRENSPLKQASDAIAIDTTGMSIDEVVLAIENIAKQKLN
ncbi:(d)CMP kinase [Enterococcus columbae]|uniref:Cytidylate kinase n=1 Tax=Enterococcus columbae DSM 7374 = ATCC 51263 TaxID=1121865 RepID=S1P5E1_9ENTE|nr:(d)CMP kinase [Enterococcus columbae]EOT42488.1 cytidylate kinase [Enterococcus columbae DSM 7374 = ATCC 51263]EOW87576.1 cytidylate kinase [Enterococcus columbae DSM 7374 = ATCC 51263]OJG23131.1 cytidylate kinase [Enterococcus columbae DSM 7374 = ATCC 51263]